MYYLFLTALTLYACPIGECSGIDGVCLPSGNGVLCGECGWTGWLSISGGCILGSTPTPTAPPICPTATCLSTSGVCVPSVYGVRCEECSYRGHLTLDGICECYDPTWRATARCTTTFPATHVTLNVEEVVDSVYCEPFQSRELGCFADGLDGGVYGAANPYTPSACCSEIYGPPPGQLVETGTGGWQECNTYGSWDPNEPFGVSPFRTCSGHGSWDPTTYHCTCDHQWMGVVIGSDHLTAEPVYTCRSCFGFWGPKQELDEPAHEVDHLYCDRPWTPGDDGELAECGGHGEWIDGRCSCDSGWGLGWLEGEFNRVYTNGTTMIETHAVEVCIIPSPSSPSSPSAPSAPSDQPTPSAPVCHSCQIYGPVSIAQVAFMPVPAVPDIDDACCRAVGARIERGDTVVIDGTCGTAGLDHVANIYCAAVAGCRAWTWMRVGDEVEFRLTTATAYNLVASPKSSSGVVCAPTASPTVHPTQYPTQYPTA